MPLPSTPEQRSSTERVATLPKNPLLPAELNKQEIRLTQPPLHTDVPGALRQELFFAPSELLSPFQSHEQNSSLPIVPFRKRGGVPDYLPQPK